MSRHTKKLHLMKCKECGELQNGYKVLFDHQRDEHNAGPHAAGVKGKRKPAIALPSPGEPLITSHEYVVRLLVAERERIDKAIDLLQG